MNYRLISNISADNFLLEMLKLGKPIETSLVGAFDKQGRGSRRDIDLPLHRDGDYSIATAIQHSIDWVGLYCIKGGKATTLIEDNGELREFNLQEGQAIILDNKLCRHGRRGKVGDRLLLRVWIENEDG
tara:strand:- start:13 stop:399 length:387 start_codon:yes stop_codon:yes gene_type:complete